MAYNPAVPDNKPFASRRRLSAKGFISAGKGVKVTNPRATEQRTNRRTPSLGMGGVEQYKRY